MNWNARPCSYCGATPTIKVTKTKGTKYHTQHNLGCTDPIWNVLKGK